MTKFFSNPIVITILIIIVIVAILVIGYYKLGWFKSPDTLSNPDQTKITSNISRDKCKYFLDTTKQGSEYVSNFFNTIPGLKEAVIKYFLLYNRCIEFSCPECISIDDKAIRKRGNVTPSPLCNNLKDQSNIAATELNVFYEKYPEFASVFRKYEKAYKECILTSCTCIGL